MHVRVCMCVCVGVCMCVHVHRYRSVCKCVYVCTCAYERMSECVRGLYYVRSHVLCTRCVVCGWEESS